MQYTIGERIVKYRKLNGMSQKHLASKLGISSQGLCKVEKGLVSPKAATLEKFIKVLGITPNQLFGLEQIDEDNGSILAKLKRFEEAAGEQR